MPAPNAEPSVGTVSRRPRLQTRRAAERCGRREPRRLPMSDVRTQNGVQRIGEAIERRTACDVRVRSNAERTQNGMQACERANEGHCRAAKKCPSLGHRRAGVKVLLADSTKRDPTAAAGAWQESSGQLSLGAPRFRTRGPRGYMAR